MSGLIGKNGSGKSTILRLLAGHEQPDSGEVVVVAPAGIGFLAQDIPLPDHWRVADAVDDALADVRNLVARVREFAKGFTTPGTGTSPPASPKLSGSAADTGAAAS